MNYKQYNDYELVYMVRENDDFSRDILFEKYQPIIHKIAGECFVRYSSYGFDYDDFVQEANIAFQKAILYFNEEKDIKFYTFVVICIRRRMMSYCRKISNDKKNISNYEVLDIDHCIVPDPKINISSLMESLELENVIKDIMWNLPIEKSSIFELKINGFTYQEISTLLDIPISSVEFKNRTAKKKLQYYLNKHYSIL